MIQVTRVSRSRLMAALMASALVVGLAPAWNWEVPSALAQTAAPASLPFSDSAFESVWLRNDQPVASGAVARSWTWGPQPLASGMEPYTDAPNGSGKRLVQYFDKSRMEINDPKADPSSQWFVTNGLLTVELISGRVQLGNTTFETRRPADIDMASDPGDTNAPTYASFGTVSNTSAGEHRMPDASNGGYATGRIDREGKVTDDPSKRNVPQAAIAYYEKATGHNVPRVFWDFLNSSGVVRQGLATANRALLDPWVFAMGLPISDAYWASVTIDGKPQDVLIQAFERRVLTYAPGLPQGWQVQMGNIGQHYFQWRYGATGGPQKQPAASPGFPAYLSIPALGVRSNVEQVGVDRNNNMDIPKDPNNVAWFQPGTVPGNPGNAAIDGHLDWYGIPQGVFYFIGELKAGDRVYVRDTSGRDRAFVVTRQATCNWQSCPLQQIFGPTTGVHLNLITCAGVFNRSQQNYDKRLVVFAELAP